MAQSKTHLRAAYKDLCSMVSKQQRDEWKAQFAVVEKPRMLDIYAHVTDCALQVFRKSHCIVSDSTFEAGGFLTCSEVIHSYPGYDEWIARWGLRNY